MYRLITTISFLMCSALSALAQSQTLSFTMDNSDIYPGTARTIKVYVPSAYDGKTPACLAVMMDDIMYGLTSALDTLYAEGKMPLTIAVGVTPGRINDEEGGVIRYNRSNEFDRIDGKFASFLEKEVLPMVEKQVTSDGREIRISPSADDRMILGASSGAIAAFAAAYNRPDLFSRVYSIVGTYVPMRGGDMLPGLVRKTEPKRIRVYLQDNDEDSWNLLFGSWYEYNLLMNSALEWAGYEVRHSWDKGGHNGNNGAAHMKEALEYLWQGWPGKVGKGTSGNATLTSILDNDSEWKQTTAVTQKSGAFSGDEAVYPGGAHVAKIDWEGNWVLNYTLDKDGNKSNGQQFYYLYAPAKSIAFDDKGYLYCATSNGIELCDHNGRVRVILSLPFGKQIESFQIGKGIITVKTEDGLYYTRKINRKGVPNPKSAPVPESEGQG